MEDNRNMSFEEFQDTLKEKVEQSLYEKGTEAEVVLDTVQKLNENYHGMRIKQPGENVAPTLNMDKLYESYENGTSLDEIMSHVTDIISQPVPNVDVSEIKDYDAIKDKLFVRVSNAEKNEEVLETLPHTIQDDMAVTYHILFSKDKNGIASAPINEGMLETYGVTVEQLHEDAMRSSQNLFPVEIMPMSIITNQIIHEQMEAAGFDEQEIQDYLSEMQADTGMYVVSNDARTNGASAIFYPGVMDQLAEQFDGDYFILPSSTDEVIVIPDTGEQRASELNAMVQEVNATQVSEEMRLGNEAYHYDADERVFEKAASFEERMAERSSEKEVAGEKGSILKKLDAKKQEVKEQMKDAVTPKRTAEAVL